MIVPGATPSGIAHSGSTGGYNAWLARYPDRKLSVAVMCNTQFDPKQNAFYYARVIETRRTGVYRVNDAERAAIAEGMAQANRGEFVDETRMLSEDRRYRV